MQYATESFISTSTRNAYIFYNILQNIDLAKSRYISDIPGISIAEGTFERFIV